MPAVAMHGTVTESIVAGIAEDLHLLARKAAHSELKRVVGVGIGGRFAKAAEPFIDHVGEHGFRSVGPWVKEHGIRVAATFATGEAVNRAGRWFMNSLKDDRQFAEDLILGIGRRIGFRC